MQGLSNAEAQVNLQTLRDERATCCCCEQNPDDRLPFEPAIIFIKGRQEDISKC
jgi:hypothetical protein